MHRSISILSALTLTGGLLVGTSSAAWADSDDKYQPIERTKSDKTVTLTGDSLTIQDVVDVARHGAKVKLSDEHAEHMNGAYDLMIEGARQDIPIYRFNRGAGASRGDVIFEGDPYSEENFDDLAERRQTAAEGHAWDEEDERPFVNSEEIVRAMMVVRANTIKYVANGPGTAEALVNLLNNRIAPVTQGDGFYHGEGDLPQMGNVEAAMVGSGDVHYKGERMPASEALEDAGLDELSAFARDDPERYLGLFRGVYSTNAYTYGQAALLVHDAKEVLDWHDLGFSVSMNGLNSSITPLTAVPQRIERPLDYANWQSERLLGILDGSYLFDLEDDEETHRIIQDPLSYRTYPQRNATAWKAWDELRRTLLLEINSSDHNPSTAPDVHPGDSPELDSEWVRQYYVEPNENTKGGFILSNSNFNKTELSADVEHFTISLSESLHTILLRTLRIGQPFFSVIEPEDVLSEDELERAAPGHDGPDVLRDLVDELQTLANPIHADARTDVEHPDETTTYGSEKVSEARLALDTSKELIAQELLIGTYWMNVREAEIPERQFGPVPTSVWEEFRKEIPWQADPGDRPSEPSKVAYSFIESHPASEFLDEELAARPDVRDTDGDSPGPPNGRPGPPDGVPPGPPDGVSPPGQN